MSDDLDGTLLQGEEQARDAQERSFRASQPVSIPGYNLESRLGEGTFGEVWRAVQIATGQTVAVKVLRTRKSSEWEPFLREVQRLSAVAEHPNIVTLLDAGLQHEPAYFVMPLLSGSLSAQEKAPTHQVAGWMKEAAEALRYTHSKGILHCDLKPANLLLDQENHVRVADFGQSAQSGERGTFWGTLGTMAPEQAGPPPGHESPEWPGSSPDVSWDVYGLGATFYRLLTGIYPRLDGVDRSSLTSSLKSYARNAWEKKLVPIRRINPKVDRDLAAIVEKCLEPKLSKRLPSAGHILDELERRQKKIPLHSRPSWTYYVVKRWMQRNPLVPILGGVAAATLSAVLLGSGYYFTQAEFPEAMDFSQIKRPVLPPVPAAEQFHKNLLTMLIKKDAESDVQQNQYDRYREYRRNYSQLLIPKAELAKIRIYLNQVEPIFRQTRSARLARKPYAKPEIYSWTQLLALQQLFGLASHESFASGHPDAALSFLLDSLYLTYPPATNAPDILIARAKSHFSLEMYQHDRTLYHRGSTPALRAAIVTLENTVKDRPPMAQLLIAYYFEATDPYRNDPVKPYLDALYSRLLFEVTKTKPQQASELNKTVSNILTNPAFAFFHPVQSRATEIFNQRMTSVRLWQAAFLNEARFAGIRLDLALELYHREHHKYPAKLQELVPQYLTYLPGDPFLPDAEYHYRDGTVWSVGPDGSDAHSTWDYKYREMLPSESETFEWPDTPDYIIAGDR